MNKSQETLSNIIINNKYAKYLPLELRKETWEEIVTRNKEMHIKKFPSLKEEIEENYKLIYDKKILPSMRSMQFSGKPIEINNARMYNCCYLPIDDYRAFSEIMFLLLSGCGVGYSVQTHHIEKLPTIKKPNKHKKFLISDNIEGWADAIKFLFKGFFEGTFIPNFDYSDIRPKGTILKTAGGKAPGHEPLKKCLFNIQIILERKQFNEQLTSLEVHDIICFIADAVLSGGIRRSALISLFNIDDEEMLTCKSGKWWELNPQRGRANNSVLILRHKINKEKFFDIFEYSKNSGAGEPGIYLSNNNEWGTNPCCEISLRAFQFCNLCEIDASKITNQEELNKACKVSSFIGTLQASYTDFHYIRDIWKKTTEKEALIGIGMTGLSSNTLINLNIDEATKIIKEENKRVSKKININSAYRQTTIKPSGTASLVLGCSSGIHSYHDEYYLRRITLNKEEGIYKYLIEKIPNLIEDDIFNPHNSSKLIIPIKAPENSYNKI